VHQLGEGRSIPTDIFKMPRIPATILLVENKFAALGSNKMHSRFLLATIASLSLVCANVPPVLADIFTFNLNNVTFSDGGTAIGSFSFDNTPSGCTGSGSCDYPITNVAIVTSSNGPFGLDYGAPPSPFNLLGAYVEYPTQGPSQPYTSIFIRWSIETTPGSSVCPCETLCYLLPGGFLSFPIR
jgi:hypothetical protein